MRCFGSIENDAIDDTFQRDRIAFSYLVQEIKTSTGKTKTGATLKAASVMLQSIHNSRKTVGFKASGGIRNQQQAEAYLNLAQEICGKSFIHPDRFRFGVSGLLDNLLNNQQSRSVY